MLYLTSQDVAIHSSGVVFYMSTETQNSQSHKVMLSDRENGEFTGIEKVISAEPEEIICDTSMGRLCVRGRELVVKNLDSEKCSMSITGEICGLNYAANTASKFKRLFK